MLTVRIDGGKEGLEGSIFSEVYYCVGGSVMFFDEAKVEHLFACPV